MKRRVAIVLVVLAVFMALSTSALGANKVTICHKPDTPAEKTLNVSARAVAAHERHGDYVGECGAGDDDSSDGGGVVTR